MYLWRAPPLSASDYGGQAVYERAGPGVGFGLVESAAARKRAGPGVRFVDCACGCLGGMANLRMSRFVFGRANLRMSRVFIYKEKR